MSLVDRPQPTQGTAACWLVSAINNTILFATNTAGNDISSLSVDAARDSQSRYLYVLARNDNSIVSYRIGQDGQLTQIDLDGGLTDRASGMVVTR